MIIMTYIDYINQIWELNRIARFTPAEREILFYLLNECNKQYWQMPIYCPTAIMAATLGINKSTIWRAREQLAKRGIISFTEGVQNSRAPSYTLLINATADAIGRESARATAQATYIKTTDDNNQRKDLVLSLEELENRMIGDSQWQQSIMDELNKRGMEIPPGFKINDYVGKFFSFLRIKGYKEREERDCRSHFFNKLVKEYIKASKHLNNEYLRQINSDRRRGCDAPTASAQEYEVPF